MKHAQHQEVLKRLKRAHGHLRCTMEMIEAGRPCPEVAQQLHAVSKAIEQAKRLYIHDHIDHCLEHAVREGSRSADDAIHEFKELTKYL